MRWRAAIVAIALGCALGGLRYLPRDVRSSSPPPPVAAGEEPALQTAPPPTNTEWLAVSATQPTETPAPDAEQVLRELEPLAATDKPLALSRALAADARLSSEGVMAEARRALIVTLLVDTERMPEARARTREFIRRYPGSRYVPLVQGVTGIHPRPLPSRRAQEMP